MNLWLKKFAKLATNLVTYTNFGGEDDEIADVMRESEKVSPLQNCF